VDHRQVLVPEIPGTVGRGVGEAVGLLKKLRVADWLRNRAKHNSSTRNSQPPRSGTNQQPPLKTRINAKKI
jgi:hypothetical protein